MTLLFVATAQAGFTSLGAVLPAFAFHAVTAVAGVALVARSKRPKEALAEAA